MNEQDDQRLSVGMQGTQDEDEYEVTIDLTEEEFNRLSYIAAQSNLTIEELVIHATRVRYL